VPFSTQPYNREPSAQATGFYRRRASCGILKLDSFAADASRLPGTAIGTQRFSS
jgi:hypothetical protein